jgi:hypothetical protein
MTAFTNSGTISIVSYGHCFLTVPVKTNLETEANFKFNGISVDQSQQNNFLTGNSISACQEFKFPLDYIRANQTIPELSGFQIYVSSINNLINSNDTASIKYFVDRYDPSMYGWINLASGTKDLFISEEFKDYINSNSEDNWFNIGFEPVTIDSTWLNNKFRFRIFCNSNVTKLYYKSPNPFVDGTALAVDGVSNFNPTDASLCFRILSSAADDKIDVFNNKIRSSVYVSKPSNVASLNDESYWMSKPNPSKFAVENLYFDVSKNNNPTSIDSVFIDPITPNVYCNIYYSNDDTGPGIDSDTWNNLLWTKIPKNYQITKKQNYVFPEPVFAKYIKIEFSHLQAQYYSAGSFQKPILYQKYPQWVFDYFIADYESKRNQTYDPFIQGQLVVNFDVLDLAYNYYKGDIVQTSNGLIEINNRNENQSQILDIITDKNNYNSKSIDATTLNQIKTSLNQFTSHPALDSTTETTVGKAATQLASTTLGMNVSGYKIMTASNYPIEEVSRSIADPMPVSTLNRDSVLFEKYFPIMSFYIQCRHEYREALAKFEDNRAYFVGIKKVAFQRSNHVSTNDSKMYTYGIGEGSLNVEHNDFVFIEESWRAR